MACNNPKAARVAAIMVADPKNCGAIAFSRTGDPALGDFEDAVIVTQIGDVVRGNSPIS